MPDLPSGTVTFLFTDIEGSTRLWEEQPDSMRLALARHDVLVAEAILAAGGHVFKTVGDAYCAAFARADDAVSASAAAQCALQSEAWPDGTPIRVRMALYTGTADLAPGARDYYGPTLNRVARLLAVGHGGQILLSDVTHDRCNNTLPPDCSLLPLGTHRLKDLGRPETVFQLCHPDLLGDFPPLRSLSTHPNNLPQQVTSFIGREKEVAEVRAQFLRTRMVTLTGSGGTGKTRLSLQVAAETLELFPDGVWLVELAALSDPGLVPQAVANALEVKEAAGKPILQTLIDHLQSKHLLLLLDNCEHLLEDCARLADTLLRGCPRLLLLATSREALGIGGEFTYRVPSLTLPDPRRDTTPESLAHFEAVRLFIDRAQFHQPEFQVTHQNAPALASVCHRLDGISLAIELAAARVRSLSVEEVNQKLDQRFRLLTGGSRTALPRQQTLRSLIDWSYDLLNEAEKALLCRLSVFSGGWTLGTAEAVCASREERRGMSDEEMAPDPPQSKIQNPKSKIETWEVLDLLTSLSDKSMVVAEPCDGDTRYRLLETVRQYAWERLLERGEEERWRDRHLACFLMIGEEAKPNLAGEDQQAWLERLEGEHDNLRAALQWAEGYAPEAALRLAGAIWRFWYVRGHFAEGRERLEGLLQAVEPDWCIAARGSALTGAGVLAYCQGDYAAARTHFDEGLAIHRELCDRPGIATLLNNLGNVAYDQGDYLTARALFEESLTLRRELGEPRGLAATLNNLGNVANEQDDYLVARALFEESLTLKRQLGDPWGIAISLSNLGLVAYNQGDYPAARAFFDESLTIRRGVGDRAGIAISLNNLGNVALVQGEGATARALFWESLVIKRELGDRWGIAFSLEGLAAAETDRRRAILAARLWGAAECLREEIGAPIPLNDQTRYERQVAEARAVVNDDVAFDAAWQAGRANTVESVIGLAQDGMDG